MPVKYQPDYTYLRHVKIRRVHLFTFIQMICMAFMWIVKKIKMISIAFPVSVSALTPSKLDLTFIWFNFVTGYSKSSTNEKSIIQYKRKSRKETSVSKRVSRFSKLTIFTDYNGMRTIRQQYGDKETNFLMTPQILSQ